MLVSHATARDGVTDGAQSGCGATVLRRNRSQCTRGYTRTSCSEDPADTLSNLALCCDGGLQCGVHAQANDRRSVCGTSSGGKLAKRKGLTIAKSTQRLAMCGSSIPSIPGDPLEDVGLRWGMAVPSIYN